MKRAFRAAGAAAAAGLLAWTGYSYREMNRPLPPEEEIEAYLRTLLERVGLGELYGTWREDSLPGGAGELRLYRFESAPDDPAVVFIPGTGVYALLYTEFMHKLSRRGFNVVGFDPRGHGRSGGKRGSYTLGELVDDARVVIDRARELYGGRVAVAGSSQGGMVAFYCAAAEPRLRAAVCHNLIAPDEPDNYRMTRWPSLYRRLMPLIPLMRMLPEDLRTPVSAYLDLKAESSRLIPDVGRFMKEDPMVVAAVSLGALASLPSTPLARAVEDIEVPVMVIHAELDDIFPEDYVRRVFGRLRCEKELLYLPGRPHLVMTDYVDDVLPAVSEWLEKRMQ